MNEISKSANEFVIEDGVPMPDSDCAKFTETLKNLNVGQSFLFKNESRRRASISWYATKLGRKFKTKKDGDLHRVWRTK